MSATQRAHRPRLVALTAVLALLFGSLGVIALSTSSASASTAPGTSSGNPIWVKDPSQVPSGAVLTGSSKNPTTCQTTKTWTLTVPGTEEVSHEVYLFTRHHEAVAPDQQYRWPVETRTWVPATSHEQYRWHKETRTKSEVNKTQYRFRTRTPLYGSKEVKSIKGWNFVDGGTTKVDGKTVAGHWVQADSKTYYQIPDVIINIVWGPNGVPAYVLGTGTVNLSVYGGPNVNVTYKAEKVQTDAGYTDWGPWSDWQDTPVTANNLTDVQTETVGTGTFTYGDWTDAGTTAWSDSESHPADTDTVRYVNEETQSVSDGNAHWSDWTSAGYTDWSDSNTKPADTDTTRYGDVETRDKPGTGSAAWDEFYPSNGVLHQYDTYTTDASVPAAYGEGWTKLDEHKVIDHAATPTAVTYYAWKDGKTCSTPPPAHHLWPKASVHANCHCKAKIVLNNHASNVGFTYPVSYVKKVHGHWKHVMRNVYVPAGHIRVLHPKHLKHYSQVRVGRGGALLAHAKVPGKCYTPPNHLSHTGK